jgi:acetate---CoA ligase (ADP-forming)
VTAGQEPAGGVVPPGQTLAARFLSARTVAVVGASERQHHTEAVLYHLQRYGMPRDCISLVSPNHAQVHGEPCVPSLADLPQPPSLVVSLAPASRVIGVLADAGKLRVPAMMSIAEGFADAGEPGRRMQDELAAMARELDVALLGPNTLGYIAPGFGVGAWVGDWTDWGLPPLAEGQISVVAQSSGMLNLLLQLAARRRIGIRAAVSVGNEAVTDAGDFVRTFAADPGTNVIGLVLESTSRPRTLVTALRAAREAGKHVVVLKFGSSALGMQNAASHSGRLASGARVWAALFTKLGVGTAEDFDQFLDGIWVAARLREAGHDGRGGIGVLSVSGGDCGLVSDLCESQGLRLAVLSEQTRQRMLAADGNRTHASSNPVDLGLIGHATDVVRDITAAVADDEDVTMVVTRLAMPWAFSPRAAAVYEVVHEQTRRRGLPLVVMSRAAEPLDAAWFEHFSQRGVPLVTSLGLGLRMLRDVLAGMRLPSWHRGWPADAIPEAPGPLGEDRLLGAEETAGWLGRLGLPVVGSRIARSAREAADAAAEIGYPVCVKGIVPGVVHKSTAGLVRLGLADSASVRAACAGIAAQARGLGSAQARFEVQQMVDSRAEVMLGMTRDPLMGPVLTIGAGGTDVELVGDVSCLLPPVTPEEVADCLGRLRSGARLLGDADDRPGRQALLELVAAFSREVARDDSLGQVDLNPVVLTAAGEVKIVDAVVAVARAAPAGLAGTGAQ